jgi:hypothetical protein
MRKRLSIRVLQIWSSRRVSKISELFRKKHITNQKNKRTALRVKVKVRRDQIKELQNKWRNLSLRKIRKSTPTRTRHHYS